MTYLNQFHKEAVDRKILKITHGLGRGSKKCAERQ